MSGNNIGGLDSKLKKPVITIGIMLAVVLLAAACSDGSRSSQGPGAELALQARPVGEEVLAKSHIKPVEMQSLRAVLAGMVRGPGLPRHGDYLAGLPLVAGDRAMAIYESNGFEPLWIVSDGHFTPSGALLVDRLESAAFDALDPAAYHVDRIHALMDRGGASGLAAAELLLSDALVRYSADLQDRKDRDASILGRATSADDFAAFLDGLAPSDPEYRRLHDALVRYNAIAMLGGWDSIPAGPTLRPGDTHKRVAALRRRLAFSGDLPETADTELTVFDEQLEAAVRNFQGRHGLDQDGAVGPNTLKTLNIPVEFWVAQLAENLRLQRKPEARHGDRAIVVNVAAFELVVYEGGQEVLRSRTVVGQPDWETPRLVSEVRWLELNPTWSVPRRIANEEIVPRLRRHGKEYLDKRGIRLFDAKWQELDTAELDMAAVEGDRLPYFLRQDPGPANPLGDVKFMFPNDEAIFLHDTRQRRLFERANRAVSHGCVRVEASAALAMLLLRDEGWSQADYEKVLKSGTPHRVVLRNPMPVHIVTRTAWVEPDGAVQFRTDPYAAEKKLRVALN